MYKDNSNSDRDSNSDSDDKDDERSTRDSKSSNDDEGQSSRDGMRVVSRKGRWRTRGHQAAAVAAAAAAIRDMPVVKARQRRW